VTLSQSDTTGSRAQKEQRPPAPVSTRLATTPSLIAEAWHTPTAQRFQAA
jgi:hypothetical protein